jgi:hypothetical protein
MKLRYVFAASLCLCLSLVFLPVSIKAQSATHRVVFELTSAVKWTGRLRCVCLAKTLSGISCRRSPLGLNG